LELCIESPVPNQLPVEVIPMSQMPRESGKRFFLVAATALGFAALTAYSSGAVESSKSLATREPVPRASQHATSVPDMLMAASQCSLLPELVAPSSNARSVLDFGAVPDDERDDTAAIQRALDALRPGQWLVFPPGRYLHSSRLRVTVPATRLWGRGAVLHATNPADMAVMLMADGTGIYGFTLTAITEKRGNKPHEARIAIHPRASEAPVLRGNEVRGNRIVADAARDPRAANSATTTGIFVYRAREFLIADNYVERSLADGIHITAGSSFGRVVRNTVRETGDDMIALVSYLGRREESAEQIAADLEARIERGLVHDVVVEANDLAGQYWGRGISLVGARGVTVRGNRISDTTTAAAIYIARESGYRTAGVRDVVIEGNEIRHVQTTAPRYVAASAPPGRRKTGHAGILVVAQISDEEAGIPSLLLQLLIRGVRIEDNRIEDTANDAIRISGRGGGASADQPVSDITIAGNRAEQARGRALALEGAGERAQLTCRGNASGGKGADLPNCGAGGGARRSAVNGAALACAAAPAGPGAAPRR
jgi:hypothetical protein